MVAEDSILKAVITKV